MNNFQSKNKMDVHEPRNPFMKPSSKNLFNNVNSAR